MNCELQRTWNEAIVACFKELSWHLPVGTKETHENLSFVVSVPSEIQIRHLMNTFVQNA